MPCSRSTFLILYTKIENEDSTFIYNIPYFLQNNSWGRTTASRRNMISHSLLENVSCVFLPELKHLEPHLYTYDHKLALIMNKSTNIRTWPCCIKYDFPEFTDCPSTDRHDTDNALFQCHILSKTYLIKVSMFFGM